MEEPFCAGRGTNAAIAASTRPNILILDADVVMDRQLEERDAAWAKGELK
jgi:hypothetical protein